MSPTNINRLMANTKIFHTKNLAMEKYTNTNIVIG
jgi:hypothetical protein